MLGVKVSKTLIYLSMTTSVSLHNVRCSYSKLSKVKILIFFVYIVSCDNLSYSWKLHIFEYFS